MPLIIITGHACSGKTHRAQQIAVDFRSRISAQTSSDLRTSKTVTVIPSNHASQDESNAKSLSALPDDRTQIESNPRDLIYTSAKLEKTARAEEFTAIKRAVSKHNVVIADSLNYIKGFRYQLWCEAKAVGTRCVVVHAAAREDEVRRWNNQRLEAWGLPDLQVGMASDQGKSGTNRDVIGDLTPASHTNIYGDRVANLEVGHARSCSSSVGGEVSDDTDSVSNIPQLKPQLDTMTLKSLYISDANNDDLPAATAVNLPSSVSTTAPTSAHTNPPSPTSALPYSASTLSALIMRYEPPSPFSRWDTPLFTIPTSDPHPPYQSIWDAIFPPPLKPTSKKALAQLTQSGSQPMLNDESTERSRVEGKVDEVRRHAATVLPKAVGSNALQILEAATSDTVKSLLAAAREQGLADGEGGALSFVVRPPTSVSTPATTSLSTPASPSRSPEEHQQTTAGDGESRQNTATATEGIECTVQLPTKPDGNTPLSQPMLQRLRRKYTQIQRGSIAHGQGYVSGGRAEVVSDFVRFLNSEWGGG